MRLNGNFIVSVDVNFTQNIVMVHKEKKRGDIIDDSSLSLLPPLLGAFLVVLI